MKKLLIALLSLVLVFAFAACGEEAPVQPEEEVQEEVQEEANLMDTDDWAYIQDKGELVIGITIFDPMNYYDANGKLIGFDTEFAEAVCAALGVTPKFEVINWDTKEIELAAGTIDCIWNGMTVTPERDENMDFSTSYFRNKVVAVTKAENLEQYPDLAAMEGKVLVSEVGSTAEAAVLESDALAENYIALSKQTDTLLEVKAGTADVAILDYVLAISMVGEGTDYADLAIVPGVELAVEEYAIGFRTGSNCPAVVNEVIQQLADDGTLNELAEKYDSAEQLIFNQ